MKQLSISVVRVRVRYYYINIAYLNIVFNTKLGVNFLPHELQSSISELREIEVNAKIEGVFIST